MAKCEYAVEGRKISNEGIVPMLCTHDIYKPCPYNIQRTQHINFPATTSMQKYPLCFSTGIRPDLEKEVTNGA